MVPVVLMQWLWNCAMDVVQVNRTYHGVNFFRDSIKVIHRSNTCTILDNVAQDNRKF